MGKTTTVRCLLNILPSTAGELLVFGKTYDQSVATRIGYLPEERGLYTSAKVGEMMQYFGQLKGMSSGDAWRWVEQYLERVELGDKLQTRVKKLSSGQQQKIQLGIALINSPELLILDEPTKGLDPVNRALLMDELQRLRTAGATIIFITHYMDEVEKLADRLVMIKDGRRVLYGPVDEVRESFGQKSIQLHFRGNLPERADLYTSRRDGNTASLQPMGEVAPQQILSELISAGVQIERFSIEAPSLQDVFVQVQKGSV